jgi:hypothetical protein
VPRNSVTIDSYMPASTGTRAARATAPWNRRFASRYSRGSSWAPRNSSSAQSRSRASSGVARSVATPAKLSSSSERASNRSTASTSSPRNHRSMTPRRTCGGSCATNTPPCTPGLTLITSRSRRIRSASFIAFALTPNRSMRSVRSARRAPGSRRRSRISRSNSAAIRSGTEAITDTRGRRHAVKSSTGTQPASAGLITTITSTGPRAKPGSGVVPSTRPRARARRRSSPSHPRSPTPSTRPPDAACRWYPTARSSEQPCWRRAVPRRCSWLWPALSGLWSGRPVILVYRIR